MLCLCQCLVSAAAPLGQFEMWIALVNWTWPCNVIFLFRHTCCHNLSWRWLSAWAPWIRHKAECPIRAETATPSAPTSASAPASHAPLCWPGEQMHGVRYTPTHEFLHTHKHCLCLFLPQRAASICFPILWVSLSPPSQGAFLQTAPPPHCCSRRHMLKH